MIAITFSEKRLRPGTEPGIYLNGEIKTTQEVTDLLAESFEGEGTVTAHTVNITSRSDDREVYVLVGIETDEREVLGVICELPTNFES